MKKCSLLSILTFSGVVLSAGIALAESGHGGGHGEHHEPDFWHGLIIGAVNSAILFTVLIVALRKPLSEYFASRSKELKDAIEAAGKAKAEAERMLADAKAKHAGTAAEVAALKTKIEADAKAEREHMLRESEKTAARIVTDAKAMAEGERERALNELRAEANRLATELAEKKVRELITPDDQARIASDFAARLGRVQ